MVLHRPDDPLQGGQETVEILGWNTATAADHAVVTGDDHAQRLTHVEAGQALPAGGHHEHAFRAAGEHRVPRFSTDPSQLFFQVSVAVDRHHCDDVGRFARGSCPGKRTKAKRQGDRNQAACPREAPHGRFLCEGQKITLQF